MRNDVQVYWQCKISYISYYTSSFTFYRFALNYMILKSQWIANVPDDVSILKMIMILTIYYITCNELINLPEVHKRPFHRWQSMRNQDSMSFCKSVYFGDESSNWSFLPRIETRFNSTVLSECRISAEMILIFCISSKPILVLTRKDIHLLPICKFVFL